MRWRLDDGQIEVVDDRMAEVLREKTPAERVAMMSSAHHTVRLLIEASVRRRQPRWDAARVAVEVARRISRGTG